MMLLSVLCRAGYLGLRIYVVCLAGRILYFIQYDFCMYGHNVSSVCVYVVNVLVIQMMVKAVTCFT